jgi:hypothetical protein
MTVRFIVIIKANADSEAGKLPTAELIAAMGRYNEQLVKAGVMLAGEGLHPSSKGSRVQFLEGRKTKVVDGPFAETKELVAGFWLIETKSKAEALEWVKRCPVGSGTEIEVRPLHEASDFPSDVLPPEAAARENALRAELPRKASSV